MSALSRLAILAALLGSGAALASDNSPPAQAKPVAAKPAAAATQLATAAQLRQELGKLRGQVVLLNFWATWCTPCLKEIPDFLALAEELGPRGLKLVGVSMNEPAELDSLVEPFRKKHFPAFSTYLRNEPDMDTMAMLFDPAWNEILPTTWILGRDGKVALKVQGRKTRDEFRTLLDSVLKK